MDRLTIGGLAELAGVNVETVRYYERRGLLAQPEQTGRRRYTEQSVRRLALIRRAKDLGFTLAEIGELLDGAAGSSAGKSAPPDPTAEDIVNAARHKLKQVEAAMADLAALRCRLSHLVRACAAGDSGCVTLLIDSPNTHATPSAPSHGGSYVTSSPTQPRDIRNDDSHDDSHDDDRHHDGDGRDVPRDRARQ